MIPASGASVNLSSHSACDEDDADVSMLTAVSSLIRAARSVNQSPPWRCSTQRRSPNGAGHATSGEVLEVWTFSTALITPANRTHSCVPKRRLSDSRVRNSATVRRILLVRRGRDLYGLVVNDGEIRAGLAATPGYRYAEVVGDRLFVAGQVPLDAAGTLDGAAAANVQATRCLDNLRLLLGAHGFDVADIRHLVIYVVGEHQNLLDAWSAVSAWFGNDVPPATLLGVNLLGYSNQLVEIDLTVVKQPDS